MYVHRAFVVPKVASPCLDCKDRCVGCHSKCELYQKYAKDVRQAKTDITNRYKGTRAAENYIQAKYAKLQKQKKVRIRSK